MLCHLFYVYFFKWSGISFVMWFKSIGISYLARSFLKYVVVGINSIHRDTSVDVWNKIIETVL